MGEHLDAETEGDGFDVDDAEVRAWVDAQAKLDTGDLGAALVRLGRNLGPVALFDWWTDGQLTIEQLRDELAGVWSAAERPQASLDDDLWLELFGEAGFVSDPPGLDPPGDAVLLYRGAHPEYAHGMAWSADRTKAQWFVDRYPDLDPPARLYTLTAEPGEVLAICRGRAGLNPADGALGEDEYVVHPRAATRARELDGS